MTIKDNKYQTRINIISKFNKLKNLLKHNIDLLKNVYNLYIRKKNNLQLKNRLVSLNLIL